MALVDPTIAMSFRMPEMPNQMANYAQMQQIQSGRQTQELNALKMQEAQAAMQERNALRQLNPAAEDYENQLFRVNPTLGIAYRKERSAADASAAATTASQAAAAKSGFDLKTAQRTFLDKLKLELSDNPSDENVAAFGQDALLQKLYTPAQVETTVAQLLAMPPPQRAALLAKSGLSANERKPPTPLNVTRLIKERDALLPNDPNIAIYNAAIRKETEFAPRAITNVNMPPQEKAEQGERGKMLVGEYSDISKAAKLAAKILPSIDANLSILDKGFSTGFGTETVAAGAKVLAALGVADADKFATNAQVFQAKATEAVLQKQLEQ
jgi:hypothetical protein